MLHARPLFKPCRGGTHRQRPPRVPPIPGAPAAAPAGAQPDPPSSGRRGGVRAHRVAAGTPSQLQGVPAGCLRGEAGPGRRPPWVEGRRRPGPTPLLHRGGALRPGEWPPRHGPLRWDGCMGWKGLELGDRTCSSPSIHMVGLAPPTFRSACGPPLPHRPPSGLAPAHSSAGPPLLPPCPAPRLRQPCRAPGPAAPPSASAPPWARWPSSPACTPWA